MARIMTVCRPEFIHVTYIASSPEKVWEALTSGDITRQYFFGRRVDSDWKPGSAVTYLRGNNELDVHGVVLTCDPPRILSFTWQAAEDKTPRDRPTRVTFELKPMGSTVKLTVKHEYLLPGDLFYDTDTFRGINNGWPAILSNLKSLLETGKTLDMAA
jgi:uncharacterized protein YndB with AHSA1/START domain